MEGRREACVKGARLCVSCDEKHKIRERKAVGVRVSEVRVNLTKRR